MENKYKVHLAIGSYEFLEKETEGGTDEEFAKSVSDLRRIIDPKEGVSDEKFIKMIDSISIGGGVSIDDFEGLSDYQNRLMQSIKRCWKRSPMAKAKQEPRISINVDK